MDPERKAKLNEIGFEFVPKGTTKEDMWDFQFQKLREYYEKHGHCELFWAVDRFTSFILNSPTNTSICLSHWIAGNVPWKYKEDPSLSNWVITQRTRLKNDKMNPERKAKLNEIGFEFVPKGMTNEDMWDFQFQKLREYYEKHGHCELLWAVDCLTFILNTLH
jgi:hypothetical protein